MIIHDDEIFKDVVIKKSLTCCILDIFFYYENSWADFVSCKFQYIFDGMDAHKDAKW